MVDKGQKMSRSPGGVEAVGAQRRNSSRRLWISGSRHQLVLLPSRSISPILIFFITSCEHFAFRVFVPRVGCLFIRHLNAFLQKEKEKKSSSSCLLLEIRQCAPYSPQCGTVGVPGGFGGPARESPSEIDGGRRRRFAER